MTLFNKQIRIGSGYLQAVLCDAVKPFVFRSTSSRLLNNYDLQTAAFTNQQLYLPVNFKYRDGHNAAAVYEYGANIDTTAHWHNKQQLDYSQNISASDAMAAISPQVATTKQVHKASQVDSQLNDNHITSSQPRPLSETQTISASLNNLATTKAPCIKKAVDVKADSRESRPVSHSIDSEQKESILSTPVSSDKPSQSVLEPANANKSSSFSGFISQLSRQLEAQNFSDESASAENPVPPVTTSQVEPEKNTKMHAHISQKMTTHALDIPDAPHPLKPNAASKTAAKAQLQSAYLETIESAEQSKLVMEPVNIKKSVKPQHILNQKRQGPEPQADEIKGEPIRKTPKQPMRAENQAAVTRSVKRVRRSATAAFWERSYSGHTQLRFYK